MIVPRERHDKDRELECFASALGKLGFCVNPGERGGLFFGQGTALAGKKVSGTARRFGTRTVLHHGTLLVSSDLAALADSLGGIATEADTSLPSVAASPANLSQMTPVDTAAPLRDPMETAFALSRVLSGKDPEPCPSALLPPAILEKEKTSLSSREWIYDATPSFRFSLGDKKDGFVFRVEKGRVWKEDTHRHIAFDPFVGSVFSIATYFEMHAVAETLPRRKEDDR
jgi:hypothetical protein